MKEDNPEVRRVVLCPSCKAEAEGEWDEYRLRWHGHCLTCGLRFWRFR